MAEGHFTLGKDKKSIMFDLPAIVYVLRLFWQSPDIVETFLKLNPMEQAYLSALSGAALLLVWKPVVRGLTKLWQWFWTKKS